MPKYKHDEVVKDAVQMCKEKGYRAFQIFVNGICFYPSPVNEDACRNLSSCSKTYHNPAEYQSNAVDFYQNSRIPKDQNYDSLLFHRYGMYSLDLEAMDGMARALKRKLGFRWKFYFHSCYEQLEVGSKRLDYRIVYISCLFVKK